MDHATLKTELFMRHLVSNQSQIYTFILYLLPNKTDADDVLQETLIEMWNKFDEFQEGTSFIAWSLTIARFKVLSFRKKNKGSKLLFSDEIYELISLQCHEIGDSIDTEMEILKKCMVKLPEKYKQYLLMRYEKNLTFRAIAAKVNVTMQAVYKTFIKIHSNLAYCVQVSLNMEERK